MKQQLCNTIMTLASLFLSNSVQAGDLLPAPTLVVANCQATNYVAGTAINNIRTSGTTYTPKCLRVKVGAIVTFEANSHHPLQALADIAGAINPLKEQGLHTSSVSITFTQPGIFGYFCKVHGDERGAGMAGSILVEN